MKKHVLSILMTGVFLLLCLIPSVGMLVSGPSPLLANEVAPRTPVLIKLDGSLNRNVLNEVADYIGTRFALRPTLVSARSLLFEKLFHSSAEDQVVLGRDGQFYYSSTLDDYCGVSLSEDELKAVCGELAAIRDAVESNGGRFVFTVAPNKNTLIPEGMPDRFPAGHENSNLARLEPLLEEAGICYVNLRKVLDGDPTLYYKTDSHWTAEGAAKAADALLQALGRDSRYAEGPFREEGMHVGDLYQMLYPVGKGRETELVYAPGLNYETESDPHGGNAVTIRTGSPDGVGSLYCLRDSFGIALYPYLADSFAEAVFSRSADFSPEAFADRQADVVLLEIVERNLSTLLPDGGTA
jgi:hypothetical protein